MTGLLDGQPQRAGAPVFDHPWQARVFAMAVQLHEQGLFDWPQWSDRLAENIRAYEQQGTIGSSDAYYQVWTATLEALVAERLKDDTRVIKSTVRS